MKIFVRERSKSKEGSQSPRYRIVATAGGELNIHVMHLRKIDIETIAKDMNADIIYLPSKEHSGKEKVK